MTAPPYIDRYAARCCPAGWPTWPHKDYMTTRQHRRNHNNGDTDDEQKPPTITSHTTNTINRRIIERASPGTAHWHANHRAPQAPLIYLRRNYLYARSHNHD